MTDDDANALRPQLSALESGLRRLRDTIDQLVALGSGPPRPSLTPTQRAVLEVLTDHPVSSQTLARLSGHSYGGRFRTNLSGLVDLGLARRTTRGYCRP